MSLVKQRMSWWAALALLRCVTSSPASAVVALSTRLQAVEGLLEGEQIAELNERGAEAVFDGEASDELTSEETAPAGITDDSVVSEADRVALQDLLEPCDGSPRRPTRSEATIGSRSGKGLLGSASGP